MDGQKESDGGTSPEKKPRLSPTLVYDLDPQPSTSFEEVEFKENILSGGPEPSELLLNPAKVRKRKFWYPNEEVTAKKNRKFWYITKTKTKPRRLRVIHPVVRNLNRNEDGKGPNSALSDGGNQVFLSHQVPTKFNFSFGDEKDEYQLLRRQDLSFYVFDEIALEGLDGITLEALWKRLKVVFPNTFTSSMADQVWRLICNNKRINFYVLNEPRDELIFSERGRTLESETGIFIEPTVESKDIYPISIVNDMEIKGSCSTINSRKENNTIRRLGLDKATKTYGQTLVLVADQTLRSNALFFEESDPCMDYVNLEYCMLERIGRSRYDGEVTQGKMSLQCLQSDPRSLHFHKKMLDQNYLTCTQACVLRTQILPGIISGSLVHLMRFYSRRKNRQLLLMEELAKLLRERPNYQIDFVEFRQIFGKGQVIVKLTKAPDFLKFFKVQMLPYRALYPSAPKLEWITKNGIREKSLRVISLIDPFVNITAALERKESPRITETPVTKLRGQRLVNYEYQRDVFLHIVSTGKKGRTLKEINDHFEMDFYSTRMVVRKLLSRNLIGSRKLDMGRQRSLKFYAKYLDDPSIEVVTEPKHYELDNFVVLKALKGYEKPFDDQVTFYKEPELVPEPDNHIYTLDFDPFLCGVFVNYIVDPSADDLTISEIINKGRDRLLLAQSNLFVIYIMEWENMALKRPNFGKTNIIFQSGFGKIVYDYLSTIILFNNIETDNKIVFNADILIKEVVRKCRLITNYHARLNRNYCAPHDDGKHEDFVAKIYLFNALFNEEHTGGETLKKFKDVVDLILNSVGSKREMIGGAISTQDVKVEQLLFCEAVPKENLNLILNSSEQIEEGAIMEVYTSPKPEKYAEPESLYVVGKTALLTPRFVSRANMILLNVYIHKVVPTVINLLNIIKKKETDEGYAMTICRKSLFTMLNRLVKEGYIKIIQVVLKKGNLTKTARFVCDNSVDLDNCIVKSNIDQMKLKFNISIRDMNQQLVPVPAKKKTVSPFSATDVKLSIRELKELSGSHKHSINMRHDLNIGKKYGYSPKYIRLRLWHEYLFYVIYSLSQEEASLTLGEVHNLLENQKITWPEMEGLPPLYNRDLNWKCFISPLPVHQRWPRGWALICDLILRLPLSIFVKLHSVNYEYPLLTQYLDNPVTRHYQVRHLPAELRKILLYRRKYLFSLFDICKHLCYIGLLQLGPRSYKEKDQLFIYLNKKGGLLETTFSAPGYNQIEDKNYRKLNFTFRTCADVELYWSEMNRIAVNTQLGRRKVMDGKIVTVEDPSIKPSLAETLKAQTCTSAVANDTAKIPGDHRGAAGLDSSLWTYLKRNWMWGCVKKSDGVAKDEKSKTIASGAPPAKKKLKTMRKSKKMLTTRKKCIRKIVAPQRKNREMYDETDKVLMKKNRQVRVDWDEDEDLMLRFCRVAILFLCPQPKKQTIPYTILRDVLHRVSPKSRNKTAKACQRRIYFMLNNDEILRIMEANVENFLNSQTLSKYFRQVHFRYEAETKLTDAQVSIAFAYLMSYIARHPREMELLLLGYIATVDFFSNPYITLFEVLLDQVDEGDVHKLYAPPKNVEDITKDTVKSVLHCSLGLESNPGFAYQLFQIYKKYPEELIKNVANDLKKSQFFSLNKSHQIKNVAGFHSPLKFSFFYQMMKNATFKVTTFSQIYQHFLEWIETNGRSVANTLLITFNEVATFWTDIGLDFDIPEQVIILNPDIEDHSEVIEELAKRFHHYLNKIYNGRSLDQTEVGGAGASKDLDNNQGDEIDRIKNSVMRLIFRVPYLVEGDLESYFKKMRETTSLSDIQNYLYLIVKELHKFAFETLKIEDDAAFKEFLIKIEDLPLDSTTLLSDLSKIVFAIQLAEQQPPPDDIQTLTEKFEKWESEEVSSLIRGKEVGGTTSAAAKKFQAKNSTSGMDVCIKQALDGNILSIEEIKVGMMADFRLENRTVPHITDLTMFLTKERFPELATDDETIEEWKSHFILQHPRMTRIELENYENFLNEKDSKFLKDKDKKRKIYKQVSSVIEEPHLEEITKYLDEVGGNCADIPFVQELVKFIKDKQEFGAAGTELKEQFLLKTNLDLVKLLQFLTEIHVILRAGICQIVYVHYKHSSQWLIETFCLTEEERIIFSGTSKNETDRVKSHLRERLKPSDLLKVKVMPWTHLDGSLNPELFEEWLSLILSRCLDYSNIPFTLLCHQFNFIKPVDIYLLLEVLEELNCVSLMVFEKVSSSLFTFKREIVESKATPLDDFSQMYIKTTNVAGLNFGSFIVENLVSL